MKEIPFSVGDQVTWETPNGTVTGRVVEITTQDGDLKGFRYRATREEPKCIVESDVTGALAVHHPAELKPLDQ
ncbi:MAG TPA: DUF2945 domain-containing protein [Candidatus Thermoplasmatota archaeon]|nr:DUF2945 domain-containing protein [Candidatus Thermoplasmatota archaeon]